jgi:hypothetical protein
MTTTKMMTVMMMMMMMMTMTVMTTTTTTTMMFSSIIHNTFPELLGVTDRESRLRPFQSRGVSINELLNKDINLICKAGNVGQ